MSAKSIISPQVLAGGKDEVHKERNGKEWNERDGQNERSFAQLPKMMSHATFCGQLISGFYPRSKDGLIGL